MTTSIDRLKEIANEKRAAYAAAAKSYVDALTLERNLMVEAEIMRATTPQPSPKHRGWPKGKKRGPRKPKPAAASEGSSKNNSKKTASKRARKMSIAGLADPVTPQEGGNDPAA